MMLKQIPLPLRMNHPSQESTKHEIGVLDQLLGTVWLLDLGGVEPLATTKEPMLTRISRIQ